MQRDVAAQIAKQSGVSSNDLWHESWFPLFHNGAGDCHVTRLAAGPAGTSPVHAVNNDDRQTTRTYDSLTALIAHAAARWKAGAYSISDDGAVEEAPPQKAPDAVDAVIASLGHPEEHERWNAARSLGELRDPRAIPGLIRALDDPVDVVAKQAATSLGLMKAREAIAALIHALERSGPQTRNVSAWALGEMKAEAAREALTRALDDPLGMVRQSAAAALNQLDQKRR
jgi:HEAT repeat protein